MYPGDYILMIKFPIEPIAIDYCNKAGLHKGGIYRFIDYLDKYSVLIESNGSIEIGSGFLKEYFKKSNRMYNLEKLLK